MLTCIGNFSENAENLAKAGGRAIGKIISTKYNNKDIRFNAYEKLYFPVLDYTSIVWGYNNPNR